MWPGFDSRTRRHMWIEFVVGSRPCSERFFFRVLNLNLCFHEDRCALRSGLDPYVVLVILVLPCFGRCLAWLARLPRCLAYYIHSIGDTFQIELEFRSVGFWGEGKTGEPGEKPLGAGTRTSNKLNPHMTPSPGIEPGPHWWEACMGSKCSTTAPSLLPWLVMAAIFN